MIRTFEQGAVRSLDAADILYGKISIGTRASVDAAAELRLSDNVYYRVDPDTGELQLRTSLPESVSPWQGGPPAIGTSPKSPGECNLSLSPDLPALASVDIRGAVNTRIEVAGLALGRLNIDRVLDESEREKPRSRFSICEISGTTLEGDSYIHLMGGGALQLSEVAVADDARLFVVTHGGGIAVDRSVRGDLVMAQVAGECNEMCAFALNHGGSLALPTPGGALLS